MKEITKQRISESINSYTSPLDIFLTIYEDGKYYASSKEEFKDYADRIDSDEIDYVNDRFDCDNFAGYFKNILALRYGVNSVGKVLNFRETHSYNIIVFSNGEVSLYEPQTNELFNNFNHRINYGIIII